MSAVASPWLSRAEAAEYLGVSESFVAKAAAAGRLPHRKIGTRVVLNRGALDAVIYDRSGKRKYVSGISAVQALAQAQSWRTWQDGLKDDAANKFVPSVDNVSVAVPVIQRASGATAQEAERRANAERRIISFASGTPELVDSHGDLLGDTDNPASHYRGANEKETTR